MKNSLKLLGLALILLLWINREVIFAQEMTEPQFGEDSPASASLDSELGKPAEFESAAAPTEDLGLKHKEGNPAKSFAQFDQTNPSSGAYTFSLPIELPPGRAGMQPSVSLDYSSDGPRRGYLGVGWSLNPTDCIERHGPAARDVYRDTFAFGRGAPEYASTDTFYLNGQRLVSCDEQVGGATPSCPTNTYRTETNNFERIERQPSDLPDGWRVTKPDGTIVQYNMRRVASINPVVLQTFDQSSLFCITSVSKNGSEILYTYQDQSLVGTVGIPSGVLYPTHIRYGGPIGGLHPWEVTFYWGERPDYSIDFSSSMKSVRQYRLSAVDVARRLSPTNTERIRRLVVEYEQSPDSGLTIVNSITEYGRTDTDRLPPHQFIYPTGSSPGWQGAVPLAPPGASPTPTPPPLPALTGLSTSNSFVDNGDWSSNPEKSTGVFQADINGDGFVDLIRHRDDQEDTKIWLGDGQGWHESTDWETIFIQSHVPFFQLRRTTGIADSYADNGVRLVDLNGDGHLDIVQAVASDCNFISGACPPGTFYVGIWNPNMLGSLGGFDETLPISISFKAALSNGNNKLFFTQFFNTTGSYAYIEMGSGVLLLDVNGDGFADIVRSRLGFGTGDFRTLNQVWLNTGSTFRCAQVNPDGTCPDVFSPNKPWRFPVFASKNADDQTHQFKNAVAYLGVETGDLNGDKLPDIVQAISSPDFTPMHSVWVNNGQGWSDFTLSSWGGFLDANPQLYFNYQDIFYSGTTETNYLNFRSGLLLQDINGDGLDDLILARCRPGPGVDGNAQYKNKICDALETHLNNGIGFGPDDPQWHLPTESLYSEGFDWHIDRQFDSGLRLIDFNADGVVDLLQNRNHDTLGYQGYSVPNLRKLDRDLITQVITPYGGVTDVTYGLINSSKANPELPFPKLVVKSITQDNGKSGAASWSATKVYNYYNGRFDSLRRQFAGFGMVSVQQPAIDGKNLFITTWFKNGDADFCRTGSIEYQVSSEKLCDGPDGISGATCLYNPSNYAIQVDTTRIQALRVHSIDSSVWHNACPSGSPTSMLGPFFNPVNEKISTALDPNNPTYSQTSRNEFVYDSFGNLYRTIEHGDLTGQAFYRDQISTYAPANTQKWILNKACIAMTRNGAGRPVRATATYYDGSGAFCVTPTKGLITQSEDFGYDANGGLNAHTWQTFSYSPAGNLLSLTDARNNIESTLWDYPGLEEIVPRATVNAKGQTTSLAYDDFANLTNVVSPNNISTTQEYDGLNRLWHVSAQSGEVGAALPESYIEYIVDGNPDNQRITKKQLLDEASNSWLSDQSWIDGLGREYLSIHKGTSTSLAKSTQYNSRGLVQKVTIPYYGTSFDMTRPAITYRYDALGREVSHVVPGGYSTQINYSLLQDGSKTYAWRDETTPNDGIVVRKHMLMDEFNRLVKVVECSGSSCDNPLNTQSNGQTTSYLYDIQDNQTDVCMADGYGDCTSPNSSRIKLFYDGLSRKIGYKGADTSNCIDTNFSSLASGCPERFQYDDAGNLHQHTDAAYAVNPYQGTIETVEYDELNRETSRSAIRLGTTTSYTFQYDTSCLGNGDRPIGRLTLETRTQSGQAVSNCNAYFASGRLKSRLASVQIEGMPQPVSALFSFSYLNNGTIASSSIPGTAVPEVLTYGFDDLGRATSLTSSTGTTLVSGATYDAFNRQMSANLGGIISTSNSFRDQPIGVNLPNGGDQRLSRITAATSNGSILNLTYNYDKVGNISSIVDGITSETERFTYDYLNRISTYSRQGSLIEGYSYDSLGNRTRKDVFTPPSSGGKGHVIDANINGATGQHSLPKIKGSDSIQAAASNSSQKSFFTKYGLSGSGSSGPHAGKCLGLSSLDPCQNPLELFAYDANGNITRIDNSTTGVTQTFQYDHSNNVIGIDSSNGQISRYWYGVAPGERIASREDGVLTLNFDQSFQTIDGNIERHYFFNGQRIATRVGSQPIDYYVVDHLQSVRAVIDQAGNIRKRINYLPFGEIRSETGTATIPYKFNGNELDNSGFYNYKTRNYMPTSGSFLQPDPAEHESANPQTLNMYSYVFSNPLKWQDPTGRSAQAPGRGATISTTGTSNDSDTAGLFDEIVAAEKANKKAKDEKDGTKGRVLVVIRDGKISIEKVEDKDSPYLISVTRDPVSGEVQLVDVNAIEETRMGHKLKKDAIGLVTGIGVKTFVDKSPKLGEEILKSILKNRMGDGIKALSHDYLGEIGSAIGKKVAARVASGGVATLGGFAAIAGAGYLANRYSVLSPVQVITGFNSVTQNRNGFISAPADRSGVAFGGLPLSNFQFRRTE